MQENVRAYFAEFIGTFTLVFVGTAVATLTGLILGSILDPGVQAGLSWILIAFAFGMTLLTLAYAIGGISGCHINPAVTIAMWIAKKIESKDAIAYIIVQIVGAIVASIVLLGIVSGFPNYDLETHGLGANGNPQDMAIGSLFLLEVVLTALFLFVIFGVTHESQPKGFAPIPIGMFLFVAHLIGVPLGDSSLNPARSLGPALIVGGDALELVWLFIIAPIAGAIIGFILHSAVYGHNPSENEDKKE